MEKYFAIIKKSPIFNGISDEEIIKILKNSNAYVKEYTNEEYILNSDTQINSFGLVLDGSVFIINEDFWGNRNVIVKIVKPNTFGESFAVVNNSTLSISVISDRYSKILWINIKSVFFNKDFNKNLLNHLAKKNIYLNKKIAHMGQRSTRKKLLSFLSDQAIKNSSNSFLIPYNIQQLADYLSIDRSAMSKELSNLKDEGYLEFNKNKFILLKD